MGVILIYLGLNIVIIYLMKFLMNKKKYNSPNISISKVYTKTGDRGHTCL